MIRVHRRTGELKEIDIHELPPLDEGDEVMPYAFKAGEKVRADHPAVEACPGAGGRFEQAVPASAPPPRSSDPPS